MNAAQIRFVVSSHSAVRVMVAVKGLVAMIRAAMILAAVVLVVMIRAVVTVMILQQNVMRDVMAHTAARDHAATTRAEQIVTVNRENARPDVMDLMAPVATRLAAIILAGANVTANKPSVKRDVKDQMEIVATQRAAMIPALLNATRSPAPLRAVTRVIRSASIATTRIRVQRIVAAAEPAQTTRSTATTGMPVPLTPQLWDGSLRA